MRRHEASNAQKKPLAVLVTGDQIFFSPSLLQVMNETAVWNEMNSFWA
jgi:hypothetical protein